MVYTDLPEDAQLMVRLFVDDVMYQPTTTSVVEQFISDMCLDYDLSSDEDHTFDEDRIADVWEAKDVLCSSHEESVHDALVSPMNTYYQLATAWSAVEVASLGPIADIVDNNWCSIGLAALIGDELDRLQASSQYSELGREATNWIMAVQKVVEDKRNFLTAMVCALFTSSD